MPVKEDNAHNVKPVIACLTMHGIDEATVDEVLASTFKQLTKSLMEHDNKAIKFRSHALRSLLSLRQHISDAKSDASSH